MVLQSPRSEDLAHAQVTPETLPSGSVRAAAVSTPTLGWDDDRSIIPASSTFVTVTDTSSDAVLGPSEACTVTA